MHIVYIPHATHFDDCQTDQIHMKDLLTIIICVQKWCTVYEGYSWFSHVNPQIAMMLTDKLCYIWTDHQQSIRYIPEVKVVSGICVLKCIRLSFYYRYTASSIA